MAELKMLCFDIVRIVQSQSKQNSSTFESEKIGNYTYIDLWLNVKLKHVRFFVKYEHFNSNWNRKDYYNAIAYPSNQKMLKTGIAWTFYN